MIKILDSSVADRIAAGEVIERPVSVVKELVENSVDAGASAITVEIKRGGTEYIRVTDNGSGISREDTGRAFLRHATSKIEKAGDLDSLTTLGFRGEALASIAAVSRTQLITKTAGEKTGTMITIEGSVPTGTEAVGCPDGTTIIVRDLFYNTPARRKFLSTQAAESGRISGLVTRLAMAYPGIRFRMISNENILFSTRGAGSRSDVIMTVRGRAESAALIPVSGGDGTISVEGYVSGPGESRPNRSGQIFFVNGRDVDSEVIRKGLEAPYKERLFSGRYPAGYLFMEVPAGGLDVNIHPNKKQVRFDDEKRVTEVIKEAVGAALATKDAAPALDISRAGSVRENAAGGYKDRRGGTPEKGEENRDLTGADTGSAQKGGTAGGAARAAGHPGNDSGYGPGNGQGRIKKKAPAGEKEDVKSLLTTFRDDNRRAAETLREEIRAGSGPRDDERFIFSSLEVIGTAFSTYIICQDDENIYLIDQHAAHERVNFEEFKRIGESGEDVSQRLLTPFTLACRREDTDWIKPLSGIGFEIEDFGPGTYIVRGIPMMLDIQQSKDFLSDYLAAADDQEDFENVRARETVALKACKASVRAHDVLKDEEIRALLNDLDKCENPYSCPHGRPTFIRLSLRDIRKRFGRKK